MKQALLNTKGEKTGELVVPEKIFGAVWNADLVHQATMIQQGNQRQVSAHAKDRGQVRGGGKKPWRQKGTGRARHGSTRSPIWKGGGVTHGPVAQRNYKRKLNVKMRRKALFAVLSEKLRKNEIFFLDSLTLTSSKTKELADVFKNLPSDKKSTLLVLADMKNDVMRASRNIPYLTVVQARELSALHAAQALYIVLPKESLLVLEKTFTNDHGV
jgi:large subunit ribosomal protein L4